MYLSTERLDVASQLITELKGVPGDLGVATDLGTVSGTLDLSTYTLGAQVFRLVTGSSNLTLNVTGMPKVPAGYAGSFSIRIQQGATPRTLTLDINIKESYANPPALTTTANAVDILTFMWTGVEWVCFLSAAAIG